MGRCASKGKHNGRFTGPDSGTRYSTIHPVRPAIRIIVVVVVHNAGIVFVFVRFGRLSLINIKWCFVRVLGVYLNRSCSRDGRLFAGLTSDFFFSRKGVLWCLLSISNINNSSGSLLCTFLIMIFFIYIFLPKQWKSMIRHNVITWKS